MGWLSEEFGASHEGRAVALLADGSEPQAVYVDAGSGGGGGPVSDWQIYDGQHTRPRAASLRGACSCGWRGTRSYPIDWAVVDDDPYAFPLHGPSQDWEQHVDQVTARCIPLPTAVEELLNAASSQLSALAADAPLAALRALAALEPTLERIGQEATWNIQADDTSWQAVGTALGLPERDARSRLYRYGLRH